jgi:hypothetical protein
MRTKKKLWRDVSSILNTHLNRLHQGKSRRGTAGRLDGEDICEVELGLYLLSQVVPHASARTLWVLMAGYEFPLDDLVSLSAEQRRLIGTVRHILLHFKSARRWQDMLTQYREVEERFRLYDVDEALEHFTLRQPSVCSEREELYAHIARHPLPYMKSKLQWASADQTYLCFDRRKRAQVTIPADLALPPAPKVTLPHFCGGVKASSILLQKEGRDHAQSPKDVYDRV